jgi:hypothetical protein
LYKDTDDGEQDGEDDFEQGIGGAMAHQTDDGD